MHDAEHSLSANKKTITLDRASLRDVSIHGLCSISRGHKGQQLEQHSHTFNSPMHTSSGHVTTVSRATGVPDDFRTLHLPLSPLINS